MNLVMKVAGHFRSLGCDASLPRVLFDRCAKMFNLECATVRRFERGLVGDELLDTMFL